MLEEAREAGMRIDGVASTADLDAIPDELGRHVYRIVQEGLTNARKHAPGSAVDLWVTGKPGDELRIEIAGDGAAVRQVATCRPHVLMDIRMPRVDGLSATETIREAPGAPDVIVLTTFDANEHVLRALRAGAAGSLRKDTPPDELMTAVRRVAAGDAQLSPSVTRAPEHETHGPAVTARIPP